MDKLEITWTYKYEKESGHNANLVSHLLVFKTSQTLFSLNSKIFAGCQNVNLFAKFFLLL